MTKLQQENARLQARVKELESRSAGAGGVAGGAAAGGKSAAEKVKEQGDLVRQLKADKAAKNVVDEAVVKLKALKLEAEAAPAAAAAASGGDGEDEVNPWDVVASSNKGIDYDKLIDKFGSSRIDKVRQILMH